MRWIGYSRQITLTLAVFVVCAVCTAESETVNASPPPNREERLARFDVRNDPEGIRRLADELAKAIDLQHPDVREGFASLYQEERYSEALSAYRGYVVDKLRNPEKYGIPVMSVSPAPPDPDKARLDKNLQQSLGDELMRNIVTVRNLKLDVGPPGAINWIFIPPGWEGKPLRPGVLEGPDDHTGDVVMLPQSEAWRKGPPDYARHFRQPCCFNGLLADYAATGDKSRLQKWADYIDDWCMNQKTDAEQSPYAILLYLPQEVERFDCLMGNLAYVANAQPSFGEDLSPTTLARFLLRRLPEMAVASIRHLRFFEGNWRYFISRRLITTGLLFGEFRLSGLMREEGRRGMEISNVLCKLPDGTDYELTPNYWSAYQTDGVWPFYQLKRSGACREMDEAWIAELQEQTWLPAQATIGQLMPSGQ